MTHRGFYAKLAAINIRNNAKVYVPYLLTCIGTVMMYAILFALSQNSGLERMHGGELLHAILSIGTNVVGIFSVIFLFYTNSFLIKRRKKEFGLFNVLGMGKRHIARVMMYETLYIALFSIGVGLGAGMLLNKLLLLMLLRILRFTVPFGFEFSSAAVVSTMGLFGASFFLLLLSNLFQIHLAQPIALLYGAQTGEREPKTKILMTIVGVLCLGGGYTIAILTENPVAAITLFFVAVVLVIVGTYCLFTAGSIALLKLLRRNSRYYYQTCHFISVSGMLYRMKQNAAGLASICILSTMVLVMVSTTVSLYIGIEDVLRTRYPRNIMMEASNVSDANRTAMDGVAEETLRAYGLTAQAPIQYRSLSFYALLMGKDWFSTERTTNYNINNLRGLHFIPLDDYNQMMHTNLALEAGEVLIYSNRAPYLADTLRIFDRTFTIRQRLDTFPVDGFTAAQGNSSHYVVVRDVETLGALDVLQKEAYAEGASSQQYLYGFDVDADETMQSAVGGAIASRLKEEGVKCRIECRADELEECYALYGGLFFLGIFLGLLFLMATVLIIYYKQISEGFDDKARFEIMQKVGMRRDEVKSAIRSQVLTVFFLPLVAACVHIAFAFPMITRLLSMLNLTNVVLFAGCTAGSMLAFGLFYAIVYGWTAKVYYRIIA